MVRVDLAQRGNAPCAVAVRARGTDLDGDRDAAGVPGGVCRGTLFTAFAMVLGPLAAAPVDRFRFFGREAISLVLVLPIALPGIITGMALNSFISFNSLTFSLLTIVIGHATFCIVTVYNNVLARLRRTQSSLVEASMDLGADGWQTFRFVTLPMIATALVAGGLLAFALSFDEVVVTTFTAGGAKTPPSARFP